MALGRHYTTCSRETARSVARTTNGRSVLSEQKIVARCRYPTINTVVVVPSFGKPLSQEGTVRFVVGGLDGIWPHTGGVNPPQVRLTSPPPSADASSSQTHNPSSPAVQTEFHFYSPSSRIAPAPNKKQTNAERESTLETLEGSLLLLALLWPFFSCRAGGGRLHASGFSDICTRAF